MAKLTLSDRVRPEARALKDTVRAMIMVQDGTVYNISQLCTMVTKASRFLFPLDQHRAPEWQKQIIAREAEVMLALAAEYVHPEWPEQVDNANEARST